MTAVLDAWAHAASLFAPKVRRWATPGQMAAELDRNHKQTAALDLIDQELVDLFDGDTDRLMVFMPPQEGKSQKISRRTPAWLLQHDPTLRIAIVSYATNKAERWGRQIRRDILTHPQLGITLRQDSRAAGRWETEQGGSLICVGIDGGITGEPVDCLRGDTRILTEYGYVRIDRIHSSGRPFRVLSFNHGTGRREWRRVAATRAIADRPLVEVVTSSGRRVTCTPDHRIHTANGYRQAALLQPGDVLTVGWCEPSPGMRGLRESPQVQGSDLLGLLHGGPVEHLSDLDVHSVFRGIQEDAGRAREKAQAGGGGDVLLACVPRPVDAGAAWRVDVSAVRGAVPDDREEVLRSGMPESGAASEDQAVRVLQRGISILQRAASLLFAGLRKRCSFTPDDRQGQLTLPGRHQLRRMVPADAPAHHGSGRTPVPCVLAPGQAGADGADQRSLAEVGALRAPHQRGAAGQPAGELDSAVRFLPWGAPQVEHDAVSVVRELRGERDTVYDLQVEGNCNFFANEVLVHNCLIIDDPIRGRAEAESLTYRESAWDWWESNGSTRLSSRGKAVLMLTRWHEDDMAGRLEKHEPGGWKVLRIPAIAGANDPLGRRPGEELASVQNRKPGHFAYLKSVRSSYVFNSIFQQTPVASEGNLFKRPDFRYWQRMPADPSRHGVLDGQRVDCDGRVVMLDDCWRFITVDLAASKRTSADFTVASAWAISPDGDLVLLGRNRGRLEEAEHWDHVRPLQQRWACDTVFIEQSFISTTLAIDATAAGIPVQPLAADTDKVTRAIPATARVRAHRVWFPAGADWLDEWCDELASFPSAAHDDQVDTLSYAARVVSAHWLPMETADQVDARRGRVEQTVIEQAYAAATGSSGGLDFMSMDYQ